MNAAMLIERENHIGAGPSRLPPRGDGVSLGASKPFHQMTYLYETIPDSDGEAVRRYEIRQSIHDEALTRHPETGEPIRRVIVGGLGFTSGKAVRPRPPAGMTPRRGCGCGAGGCGH
jgi:hypothetical protein